ncbi:MAG TPA: FAD-binding and (Fe-S)-binding domain-containing protein [Anaeromyxobacteraceae bacterium]|nr:FAD-binding and (Fe-S)-binding domain-containing protein [Anaeromyxobacteraceae bacterium]
MATKRFLDEHSDAYRNFHAQLSGVLPPDRLLSDPLRTLAYGTDASFYRLYPKLVARPRTLAEVAEVLQAAVRCGVGCTFRAAGTSLSGQAVTDSVLVQLTGSFRGAKVLEGGAAICLQPGVRGGEANALLAKYGRRIGPDPTSIDSAMVGGIAANNAAGTCCGTSEDSYQTVLSMKIVLADGTLLDTGDPASRAAFAASHGALLSSLADIRDEIAADEVLTRRIRAKYRIRNTTGYGINSFVDFVDPFDILLHLMVGSEGTLAFIGEVTYRTVEDHAYKASAFVLFPGIEHAATAAQELRLGSAQAAELMDRLALRAAEDMAGVPPMLRSLPPEACALLMEVQADSVGALQRKIREAKAAIAGIPTLGPVHFTSKSAEYQWLWNVRRGLFTAIGAKRPLGTTVVIADVAFQMKDLAAGTLEMQRLFQEHGYQEGIILGHALDSDIHLVLTQDFNDPREVDRYRLFMQDVCDTVLDKFDGSLKAEHGTGRNMAPYVEREWGKKAYTLMKRLKALFDPKGVLNPGVIFNEDPEAHVKNLKVLPLAHEIVDRCTECGFCEPRCAARDLTLSPRQRITVLRELARLRLLGELNREDEKRRRWMEREFQYFVLDTCATDGLCATACPILIDTGKLTKALRAQQHGPLARRAAGAMGAHYASALRAAKFAFGLADVAHVALGESAVAGISSGFHRLSGGRIPVWNRHVPKPASPEQLADVVKDSGFRVVYFPSCITRLWGPARGDQEERAISAAMLSILDKAGCHVLFPRGNSGLCCGLTFESKGFPELALRKCHELEEELLERSDGGAIPILCDTSPCVEHMRIHMDKRLHISEPAEFIHTHLMDKLRFEKKASLVAIHVTCAALKMGIGPKLQAVAQACAEKVVQPQAGCCAFAGDRGLTFPELNAAALRGLRDAVKGCEAGYSNSRACEIGLSKHSGIPYRSIAYLVDRCTSPLGARPTRSAPKGSRPVP